MTCGILKVVDREFSLCRLHSFLPAVKRKNPRFCSSNLNFRSPPALNLRFDWENGERTDDEKRGNTLSMINEGLFKACDGNFAKKMKYSKFEKTPRLKVE